MKTDIAVIKTKVETQEKQLSVMPTDTEVDLKISEHATDCLDKVGKAAHMSSKRRNLFTWPIAATSIVAILAALTAFFGG
jgi:hypothetical protein